MGSLADPDFAQLGALDVLLGSYVLSHIYTDYVKRGGENQPVAYGTIFGWTIGGCREEPTIKVHMAVSVEEDTNQILKIFGKLNNHHHLKNLLLRMRKE